MAQKEPIRNFVLHDRHGHEIDFSSFSVVSDVSVTFHAGVGEPYCDSRYQGGILYLDFYNIKGDGITGITYDESQEDAGTNYLHVTTDGGDEYTFPVKNGSRGNGITSIDTEESQDDDGYNVVRIHCTDDESEDGTVFRIKNGKRGNGIASVTEEMSDQDGGINTYTITDDDGQTHIIHTRNGRPGADRQPVESGDVIIAHGLGNDDTKVMSQKGVTNAMEETSRYIHTPVAASAIVEGAYLASATEGNIKLSVSSQSANKVLFFDIKGIKQISVSIPHKSYIGSPLASSLGFANNKVDEISGSTNIEGEYIDTSDFPSDDAKKVILNDQDYQYLAVSCNYSSDSDIPRVSEVKTAEYNLLSQELSSTNQELQSAKSLLDSVRQDVDDAVKYSKVPLSEESIVSKAYFAAQTVEGNIRLGKSSLSDNKVLFYDVEGIEQILVEIPQKAYAGQSLESVIAFSSEKVDTGELRIATNIQGEYVDTSDLPETNIKVMVSNDNYKYIAVNCRYSNESGMPTVSRCQTSEYSNLKEKIEVAKDEAEAGSKAFAENNFGKFNRASVEEETIVSKAYIAQYTGTGENRIQLKTSSSAANKVIFFNIEGKRHLAINIPKRSSAYGNVPTALAYTDETKEGELSSNTSMKGTYIDLSFLPDKYGKTIIVNDGNKYLAVCCNYSDDADKPTVEAIKTTEYKLLSKDIEDSKTYTEGLENSLQENLSNDILRIDCGKGEFGSHPAVWTCYFDGEYNYVGYTAMLCKYRRYKNGDVELVQTIDIDVEGSDYHIVTGIQCDENYIYAVTRDRTPGSEEPASGCGGYLLIFDKQTYEKVSEIVLVDENDGKFKAMQCYLFKPGKLIIPLMVRGWCVYDVTDVENPVCTYHQSTREHQHCAHWTADGHDYAAFTGFSSGVIIYDITNLSNPTEVATWAISDLLTEHDQYWISQVFGIKINYPYLYATLAPRSSAQGDENAVKGIVCFNVANPSSFGPTAKLATIPRKYWGETQDADGEPNNMAYYNGVILVNLDYLGLGVFEADGDKVEFVKRVTYNTYLRPVAVSEDGLFVAAGQRLVCYNRFISIRQINKLIAQQ